MKAPSNSRNRQSGAVLYVALIMLILLALIGIVAMQVAGLQERMSANYMASSMAFQNAEAVVRDRETLLTTQVRAGQEPPTNRPPGDCTTPHDAVSWNSAAPYVRRLDRCTSGYTGIQMPIEENEQTDKIYQITAYARDRTLFPTSEAVVDTVFIP